MVGLPEKALRMRLRHFSKGMKQGRLVVVRKREDFKHADLEEIYMREMEAAGTVS
jgi:hypothetical protein